MPETLAGRGRARTSARPATPAPIGGVFDELVPALGEDEAIHEAERCLECGAGVAPAPCTVACPAGVDVPGFIAAIARGDATHAGEIIFRENLLGGSCARVCPVEELCEGACVLEREGRRPVSIARLQRLATERALTQGIIGRIEAPPNGKHVTVIGAGPAGLACAGELALMGYAVTVYDARDEAGGLVRYAIAPYRQLRDPLPAEEHMLANLGVVFRLGRAIDTPGRLRAIEMESDAVFLGIGLGADIRPGFPGDDLPGVWESLPFIEAVKNGTPPHIAGDVIVLGGGNTAIDVAREALRLGARQVTIAYRRTEAEMPAFAFEVEGARREGVRFEWLASPVRFLGGTHLTAVEFRRMQLAEPDASGRPRAVAVAGSEFRLPAGVAVRALGQQPRSEFLSWIPELHTEHGHIIVDPATGRTGNEKYFAGGDALNGGATAVEAVRAGKIAARGIDRALRGGAP